MTKPDPNHEAAWPEEKVTLLLKLVAEGQSGGQIGRAIGKSRCAVLGKISRLEAAGQKIERRGAILKQGSAPAKGVAARPQPSLHSVAVSGVALAKRGRPAYSKVFGPVVSVALPEPVPLVNGERVTLLKLTSKTCKWPIGDPQEKDFCFCGHKPREKSPYCEYHARAAYQPLQERRRRVFA